MNSEDNGRAPRIALSEHDHVAPAPGNDFPDLAKVHDFAPLGKKDLPLLYRQFQTLYPEPIFIDIYEPSPFPTLSRFTDYFAIGKRPMWVMGAPRSPQAYFILHDFQREHDLANLDFAFFTGLPAPGSEEARGFWEYARRCIADRGLTRIQSFVLSGSTEKIRLLESFGFHKEGILREHYFHNGELHDVVVHAWMAEGRGV